jgi:hypothetical protein
MASINARADSIEPPPRSSTHTRALRPIDFPSEEHVPETKRHLEARTVLYLILKDALPGATVGSEQFIYYDAADPRRCLAPDVFVKLGAPEQPFDNWKVWERAAPDLAVEIISPSDRRDDDFATKLARCYQSCGIREVVRFDADNQAQPLQVWDRIEGDLIERSPESEGLRACVTLGLWWIIVPSEYGPMLRLARDREGTDVLPTPGEERTRLMNDLADERRARAEAVHQRMIAEHARDEALAEIERLRAALARAREGG